MTASTTFDILDPQAYVDIDAMHEAFTWMRANEPVYHDPASGYFGVTRHRDILDVERNDKVFSSHGSYRARRSDGENNMIALDNPAHLEQRRLVVKELVPAGVRRMEPKIRALVTELVDHVCEQGRMDVVPDLAAQFPARMTAVLLGFPEERWTDLQHWSEAMMRLDHLDRDPDAARIFMEALGEMGRALNETVPALRGCPAEAGGFLSIWANADHPEGGYADDRIFNETGLFVSGGAETTRTVIARSLATLCDHPDQWEAMGADTSLVASAVEEMIRWVTPLNNMFRRALVDTDIAGVPVPAESRIALLYPSANRDEAAFDDPFTFDIRRNPNPHVSFGFGTHFCVGANLARFELRALMEELTRRITNLRVITPPDIEANIFVGAVRSFELGFDVR